MNFDFRSIVLFLHIKGEEPKKIQSEINDTFHKNIIGYSTVTKYIRESKIPLKSDANVKEDIKLDHFHLHQLILKVLKDYPFSSIREISEITGIPKSSVYDMLTRELHFVLVHLKWVPHFLNSSQKVARVEISKSLLKTLQKASHQNYIFFYTGDESWFYLSTDYEIQWIEEGEKPATRAKKMIDSRKFMLSIFWNPQGFLIVDILPEHQKFNGDYFINNILEKI